MGNGKIWLHGLIAAFIGGGAGAVSAGFSASMLTPDHYNLGSSPHGLAHLLELMGVTFLVSGLMSVFAYLKQSPVPAGWDGQTERRSSGTTVEQPQQKNP